MSPDYTDANPYQAGLISGIEAADVEVIPVPADGVAPFLAAWRRHGRPDVLHLHWIHRFVVTERRWPTIYTILLGARLVVELLLLRLAGVGLVWTVHNVVSHERTCPQAELVLRHIVARTVDAMIVHCADARAIVQESYRLSQDADARIAVIPHGNYDAFYRRDLAQTEARHELGLPRDEPVLLYFGLIREYKRVPALIESFRSLDLDAGHLLVVGNPWNDALLEAVERTADSDPRVHTVLEYVPDRNVPTYLAAADAVVLPYDDILTSGSAILGMTFGRAVIAPRRGCLPSLLGEKGGIMFDSDSSDEPLREALVDAMVDRDRLLAAGRRNRRVADRLEWEAIGAATATVYRRIAGVERI